jgi:hypothetical protein
VPSDEDAWAYEIVAFDEAGIKSSAATEPLCVDYAQGYGIARPAPVADVFPGEVRQTADDPWDPRLPS